jgi:hypothetical protein
MMMKSVRLAPQQIDHLPQWRYREEGTAAILGRVGPNFAALAAAALGIVVLGVHLVRRYPIAG